MAHGSARLTFHGRLLIVQRHQQGWRQAHIAAAMGVSRTCVKTWLDRYAAAGEAGLHDRSCRPHRSPDRTAVDVEQRVVDLRLRERRGQDWLSAELGVPARTIARSLRRHQRPSLREGDPMTGEVIRASKVTAVRYERARPGESVHVDVKKLGRIHDGGGWKAKGREHGQTARQKRAKIGYDYVHSAVDDHSRSAYSEILPDEKGPTCAAFMLRAAEAFAQAGIATIEQVITDNHMSYKLSRDMREALAVRNAQHLCIKPHCPWQKGKVERFNRPLASEWADRQPFDSNSERAAALAPWLEHYNNQRRHTAIGGKPPISRLPR